MKLLDLPLWMKLAAAAAIAALLWGAFAMWKHSIYQEGWDAREQVAVAAALASERAQKAAILIRIAENDELAKKHDKEVKRIREEFQNETDKTTAAYAAAGRLRVRAGICVQRPATPAEAEGAAGGNEAASETIALPEQLDRDLKALMKEADDMSTTLRAAQDFIQANGLYLEAIAPSPPATPVP